MNKRVAVIGVPSSAGARRPGQELGPHCLRGAGLIERLRASGQEVADEGDLPPWTYTRDDLHPRHQNVPAVAAVARGVAEGVAAAASRDALPFVLGGDCTLALGVVAGLQRIGGRVGLLYFDADLDLNTPETSPSGILDGMGLAHLLGDGLDDLRKLGSVCPLLRESDVSLFAFSVEAGSIDPPELARLERSAMTARPLSQVAGRATDAARAAIRELEARVDHVYLHFDVDVVDDRELPLADVAHVPGLSLDDTGAALANFLASPKLAAVAVTEINGTRDPDLRTTRRLVRTIADAVRLSRCAS